MIDLDCGIPHTRIASWLDDELCLPRTQDGSWQFSCEDGCCEIRVSELEGRKIGVLALERTRLLAQGDDAALAVFDRLFTLRFMSAGG